MNKIPLVGLYDQYQIIKPEIDEAIQGIINSSAFVGGEDVRRFEEEFAAYCEAKACVGVGNGTDAIYLTLRAMGVGADPELVRRCTMSSRPAKRITPKRLGPGAMIERDRFPRLVQVKLAWIEVAPAKAE